MLRTAFPRVAKRMVRLGGSSTVHDACLPLLCGTHGIYKQDSTSSHTSYPSLGLYSSHSGITASRRFFSGSSVWRAVDEFRLAQLGEGIKECELLQWFVNEGDNVEEFSRVCEVQSDKATVEITSPFSGVVQKLCHQPGDIIQIGDVLAHIASSDDKASTSSTTDTEIHVPNAQIEEETTSVSASSSEESKTPSSATRDIIESSPATRRLARELGIDLAKVFGTGPGGRVTKEDVLNFKSDVGSLQQATRSVLTPTTTSPESMTPEEEPVVIPLRGYRRAMVRSMTETAKIPQFHFHDEVTLDPLIALRNSLYNDPLLQGNKLTYMPFFIKAAELALKQHPDLNSRLDLEQQAIIQQPTINLGIAMATPNGLVVPNIKNVAAHSISSIASKLIELQAAATANQLSQEDISGATFTISNIGTIGGTYATPLVNPPEVGIMALGKIQRVPKFGVDGIAIVPANVMNISLGADHRVVDGATLAKFAQTWKSMIENPGRLLLTLK